jgi:hypothetical protein
MVLLMKDRGRGPLLQECPIVVGALRKRDGFIKKIVADHGLFLHH